MTHHATASMSLPLTRQARIGTTPPRRRNLCISLAARLLTGSIVLLLAACSHTTTHSSAAPHDAAHNSRNSLDWAGTYSGILPCADCVGIAMRLTLDADGNYQLSTQHQARQAEPTTSAGRFTWTYDGNHIQLDAAAEHAFYAVHENALLRRHADGTWPQDEQTEVMTLRRQP